MKRESVSLKLDPVLKDFILRYAKFHQISFNRAVEVLLQSAIKVEEKENKMLDKLLNLLERNLETASNQNVLQQLELLQQIVIELSGFLLIGDRKQQFQKKVEELKQTYM